MAEKKKPKKKKPKKKAQKTVEPGTTISGCNFVGVMFDAQVVDAISTIANGLAENARALGVLARVLNGSKVNIETMLEVK